MGSRSRGEQRNLFSPLDAETSSARRGEIIIGSLIAHSGFSD
jgi:hypothetical protein